MTNKKEKVGNVFCHIYLIVLSLIAVFPLVWVLLCSVKSSGELTSNPTRFFPKHFTLENFTHVIQDLGFAKNIGNSLIIAIITTGIAIVISSMAGIWNSKIFSKTWINYVESFSSDIYVPTDFACDSILYGYGKAWLGKHKNRTYYCVSII